MLATLLFSFCFFHAPENTQDTFVIQTIQAIAEARKENSEVEFLGHGTAIILESGLPSKIKVSEKPDQEECSNPSILPKRRPLSEVIAQEEKVEKTPQSTACTWVAWKDFNGLNIAFNGKMSHYESSTTLEVEGWGQSVLSYFISIRSKQKKWHTGPRMNGAGFTWLKLGTEMSLEECLVALENLRIISSAQQN